VRIARVRGELAWIFKAQFRAKQAQLIQPMDGFRVSHG